MSPGIQLLFWAVDVDVDAVLPSSDAEFFNRVAMASTVATCDDDEEDDDDDGSVSLVPSPHCCDRVCCICDATAAVSTKVNFLVVKSGKSA
eukprot:CAMPEP_0196820542 /NCGR_PEP_ID=MMETSP1362-20130617/75790_1 /TAXON_ID=163516 /ORGANISM="Leptocylindrus danicus, Strain CCMP1856" /LENGTH=90 /DNA_ID=CAMNT_0042199471 /DNA_START=350 /DNA_END=622 /DNA_ORIENTATION=+